MRQILSEETIGKVEKLVSELRAISHWDTEYWRHRCPEWYETVAFVSRQKRRSEIIREALHATAVKVPMQLPNVKQTTSSQS